MVVIVFSRAPPYPNTYRERHAGTPRSFWHFSFVHCRGTPSNERWVESGLQPVALIVWKDAMSVGNDALDDDHIVVASLINHIDDAKQSGTDEHAVGRILRVLVDHAFAHFAREEALLEQRGYPRLAEHKREHRLVEEQLQELCEAYARTADPELSREIMQILYFWLVEHIMKVDMHYKSFLETESTSERQHQSSSMAKTGGRF